MKRCSTLLAVREMQVKTTIRYYILTAMAIIEKKNKTARVGKDVEKVKSLRC